MLKGIDVSNWQNIDFNTLDTDFIIMKSSEGYGYTDPKFYNFQKQARDKGMLIGYYHFCRPDLGNTSEAEAEYFVSVCKPSDGEVLVLDFEVSYSSKVAWCKRWLDRVCELTGCKPLVYLNKSLVSGNDWSTVINAGYGLWLADYSYDPNSDCPSTPWPFVAIRQYSNREVVPGLSGPVDGNVFYGDKEAFLKYGVNSQLPPENPCTDQIEALEAKILAMDKLIDELRESRDKWKKNYKDLEEIYTKTKTELETATLKIGVLESAVQQNKTPLSYYTWKERFLSLFKEVK